MPDVPPFSGTLRRWIDLRVAYAASHLLHEQLREAIGRETERTPGARSFFSTHHTTISTGVDVPAYDEQVIELAAVYPTWRATYTAKGVDSDSVAQKQWDATGDWYPRDYASDLGFDVRDVMMSSLEIGREMGDSLVAGRPAAQFEAFWPVDRPTVFAGLAPAESYLIDLDREWPSLKLRIQGFVGQLAYSVLEFIELRFEAPGPTS